MKRGTLGTTVPITKAIRQKVRSEIKRTGVTAMMLLKDAPDLPDELTVAHVNRWGSGILDTAPARHLEYVMDRWASLPDEKNAIRNGRPVAKRGARHADGAKRIEVTERMAKMLRAELARTGVDHAMLLNRIDDDIPEGLTARIIRGWLYRDSATTNELYWDFVMVRLTAMPDFKGPLAVTTRRQSMK